MSATDALEIRHLDVSASGTAILHDINLTVGAGELHVLFGPNGSGKSCLLATIMGLPPFRISSGEIHFRGRRIDGLPIDERARLGLGMSFQRPPGLEGVTVDQFSKALGSQDILGREAAALDLRDFSGRDINVGFSGGEIKRWEVLKLFLQRPRLCLFDEPESGVDLEHIAAVGNAINRLLRAPERDEAPRSGLVITHTGFILDHIQADVGHMLVDGRILFSGDPLAIFKHIQRNGYTKPTALLQAPEKGTQP
ncbi:ATP-binding cassette domain-containing protein [Sphingomonas histidinilytica]|uniref:ABC transporter ATP-binding protein n=1 Tax=Rhizorhabdus histidinilytica TaxID=439228 RepID=UPI001AD9A75B|nr:ATP-binding cassette domain-containing protein [Rhizorhabdus histidinilytica]MBO9379980.1 ATP-binding cassette domain-containing protein [Rhizorhabdus histidinilytica]